VLRKNQPAPYGFSPGDLAKIKTALTARTAHLCAAWSKIHGEP
jgi:hypothetical protein